MSFTRNQLVKTLPLKLENSQQVLQRVLNPRQDHLRGGGHSRPEEERSSIPLGRDGGASGLQSSAESLAFKLQLDWPPVPLLPHSPGGSEVSR